MSKITIYHNPRCGTSRNTLEMIRRSGEEPEVVLYLETPPDKTQLLALIAAIGKGARHVLREKEPICRELGLEDAALPDEALVEAMLAHPILMNRPIVVTPLGTRLCRPSEVVLEILPGRLSAPFVKEDGEVVVDSRGS